MYFLCTLFYINNVFIYLFFFHHSIVTYGLSCGVTVLGFQMFSLFFNLADYFAIDYSRKKHICFDLYRAPHINNLRPEIFVSMKSIPVLLFGFLMIDVCWPQSSSGEA
jgi:hypothetical protein